MGCLIETPIHICAIFSQNFNIEIEILADTCNLNCEKVAIICEKHFEILTKHTTFVPE